MILKIRLGTSYSPSYLTPVLGLYFDVSFQVLNTLTGSRDSKFSISLNLPGSPEFARYLMVSLLSTESSSNPVIIIAYAFLPSQVIPWIEPSMIPSRNAAAGRIHQLHPGNQHASGQYFTNVVCEWGSKSGTYWGKLRTIATYSPTSKPSSPVRNESSIPTGTLTHRFLSEYWSNP